MNKFCLILLTVIFFSYFSKGQVVELQIDKKHNVEIKPCVASGSYEIPERFYENQDTLYFMVVPKGDWDFSKGDLKILRTIQIKQLKNSVGTVNFKEIINASNKVDQVLVNFDRNQIVFTDQFVFIVEEYTSDIMEFPEYYWPYYQEFNQYYNLGKQFVEEHQYIEAYRQLKNILPGAAHVSEFSKFSNYKLAFSRYLPDAVKGYQKEQSEELQGLWTDFEANKNISSDQLNLIRLNRDSLIIMQTEFESYFSISEPSIQDFSDTQKKLIKDYNDLYNSALDVWRKSVLGILENGNYENENKYQVYIELLARMLIYTNHLERLSNYDSLDISLVSVKGKQVPFLKKHIDILEKMHWKKDFITILQLMNDGIELNSHLLGQTHLLNLRGNKELERQPNYFIINGFNELVEGNFETFMQNIGFAIAKCTDLEMMYYLELWNFMYQFEAYNTDEKLIAQINTGLEYQKKGMPKEALDNYGIAERMGSNALPPFLIGMINLKVKNEIFSAERYFNDALNIYPGFTLANIYNLKILLDSKQYDLAANKIEIVLELPELSVWYIYYLQSKLFFLQYDYEESLRIIQTKCRPLNPYFFEQYIMLGDIYLKLNNCATAKENYLNAGKLQPNNRSYSSRMQMLILQCNN